MHSIITGDIVHSRHVDSTIWNVTLRQAIQRYSSDFDIYRGDSFQVIIPIEDIFEAAFYISAKMQSISGIQVRMGIGIGTIDTLTSSVKESTGEAFIRSGHALDTIHKELIQIDSPWIEINEPFNIMFSLCGEIFNRWTTNIAGSVAAVLENPNMTQSELAIMLQKHQSQISTELNKAGFFKIKKLIAYCNEEIKQRCS